MRITLLNVFSAKNQYTNKDVGAGYGVVTKIGDSLLAKLIERKKKSWIKLPISVFGYLAAILKKNNHKVDILTNKVPKNSDLVIIHSSIIEYKTEINFAKKIKEQTKAKVGFIGPFVSFKPEIYLKYCDFVIKGEPEEIAAKISEDYMPKGAVISHPVKNLDSLPVPEWSLFDVNKYSYYPILKRKPFLPVLSSRGCSLNCNYCPYKAYYGNLRQRSIKNVVREIAYLIKRHKIKSFLFRDPLFTANRKRAIEFAKALLKRKIKVEWACETHFSFLDERLIDILYKAGLRAINVGIESSSEEILRKATRKSAKKEYQEKIIEYCNQKGVKVSAFYMLGFPDDTIESVSKTIDYAKKLNTFIAQFSVLTPFPGTKFYEKVKNELLTRDWSKFDSFTPVFKHSNLTPKQLLKLKEKAFVTYYFRPRWIIKYLWWQLFE